MSWKQARLFRAVGSGEIEFPDLEDLGFVRVESDVPAKAGNDFSMPRPPEVRRSEAPRGEGLHDSTDPPQTPLSKQAAYNGSIKERPGGFEAGALPFVAHLVARGV